MSRTKSREVWVGLVVLAGLVMLCTLLALAGGGPGFLTSRRNIDVVFRDAQGIRVGSPVRIAGLDSGRVSSVDLTEVDGALCARVRLSMASDLVARLRQDVKVTVQASLTGQACVNIVSSGRSSVALVPGQVVQGVETTVFDPILEQVGLGAVERNHLSHTIAEVRETVDAAGPRLRDILASLQNTANDFGQTADAVRPAIEATARRIDEAAPRAEATMKRLDNLITRVDAAVAENRPAIQGALANLKDLTGVTRDMITKDQPKIEKLLDGLDGTRARADRLLFDADLVAGQGATILTKSKADLERTVANVRDASDYGNKLVQKLFGNPFYLSPLYKPNHEDLRAQANYDAALTFMNGAKELRDSLTTMQAMKSKPLSTAEQQALDQLFQRASGLTVKLDETAARLADGLKTDVPRPKNRR